MGRGGGALPKEAAEDTPEKAVKSGFVAVAGRPNVGKSTLVNALSGGKVAIVSDKPQTTRRRIFGIANGDDYQLVLVDMPGFQRPRDALTERMQRTVDRSFDDVDAVLLVRRLPRPDRRRRPVHRGARLRAGRTGRDRAQQGRPSEGAATSRSQMATAAELGHFHRPAPGEREDGGRHRRAARRARLAAAGRAGVLPHRRAHGSPRRGPDRGARAREGAGAHARGGAARDLRRGGRRSRTRFVRASLYVETESQKQIVVGKGGRVVREIGTRARPEIEALLGQ